MYYVSDEWAKQIASEVWRDIDFVKVRIQKVSGDISEYHIPILEPVNWRENYSEYNTVMHPMKKEVVRLESPIDSLNKEYTRIGYSRTVNIIFLGYTRKVVLIKL